MLRPLFPEVDGWDWVSLGGVTYRTPFGANNQILSDTPNVAQPVSKEKTNNKLVCRPFIGWVVADRSTNNHKPKSPKKMWWTEGGRWVGLQPPTGWLGGRFASSRAFILHPPPVQSSSPLLSFYTVTILIFSTTQVTSEMEEAPPP